jgi:2-polyprenyl-3-methyl-5-hydroxy-6-metoxy-1,4-benzoquinol methylase
MENGEQIGECRRQAPSRSVRLDGLSADMQANPFRFLRPRGAAQDQSASKRADDGTGLVDFRALVSRYSFAEHAARADRYFSSLDLSSPVARKPFASPMEASELCGGLAVLLPNLMLFPGARVLDFGAGTCWMTRVLALLGCEVTAVDVSRKALAVGEQLVRSDTLGRELKVDFVPLDGPELPFADVTFDRVVCFDALHHCRINRVRFGNSGVS